MIWITSSITSIIIKRRSLNGKNISLTIKSLFIFIARCKFSIHTTLLDISFSVNRNEKWLNVTEQ